MRAEAGDSGTKRVSSHENQYLVCAAQRRVTAGSRHPATPGRPSSGARRSRRHGRAGNLHSREARAAPVGPILGARWASCHGQGSEWVGYLGPLRGTTHRSAIFADVAPISGPSRATSRFVNSTKTSTVVTDVATALTGLLVSTSNPPTPVTGRVYAHRIVDIASGCRRCQAAR